MIIGKKIINCKEIDSTNDEAKRLVRQGAGEGLVVLAEAQTKGRGKPGSKWFSPAGEGLYLSAVVKPFKNPQDLALIVLLGARAVVRAVEAVTGLAASIKPPNDVYLNAKKISGILVERLASGHLIIGIGVNLNNSPESFPDELKTKATSLLIETGEKKQVQAFTQTLLTELDRQYLAYLEGI